jgi:FkbM family methyltransferase
MSLRDMKLALARVLTSTPVGTAIGLAFGERIPFRGEWVDTSFASVTPEVKGMLFWRLYETGEVQFIQRYLGASLDVVELGGSIGAVSRHILRTLGSGSDRRRLVIVEANPDLLDVLTANVGGRATILHRALAYGASSVSFNISASSLGGALGEGTGRRVTVPATTLAEVRAEAGFGDYALVCDIEGAEHAMFSNEAEELQRCKRLIIELHDFEGATAESLARSLESDHGFRKLASRGPVYAFTR